MPIRPSCSSSRCSASVALTAALIVGVGAALAATPRPARACGAPEPDVSVETTFDPHVLGEPALDGQLYDPYSEGFGSTASDGRGELVADWAGYLGSAAAASWPRVLFDADLDAIDGLIFFLQGKRPKPPSGFEQSSVATAPPELREKLVASLYLVGFARRVEPFGVAKPTDWMGPREQAAHEARLRAAGDPATLQRNGEKALARAKDPFLRQRYAFLLLRLGFHRGDWAGVIASQRANAAALEGPSRTLRWRARYYLAGAFWRGEDYARANLELARIHAEFPALAGETLRDFHPMEDGDWQQTLAMAKDARERARLWQMVGITRDGVTAMAEIAKLDPAFDGLGLLAMREVNRLEHRNLGLGPLEKVCLTLGGAKKTARPWLFHLVAAHIAALRGDLPATRARLASAARSGGTSPPAQAQARATLALALARTWRPGSAQLGDELARTIEPVKSPYGQLATARRAVRSSLAGACRKAGLEVDAELLVPTPPPYVSWWTEPSPAPTRWTDPAFIQALVARVSKPQTPFDRFVVEGSGYTRPALEVELARRFLVKGDAAAAARALSATSAQMPPLGTDPFVVHIADCHDCDHDKYADAPWTLRSFAAKLAELQLKASGKGEDAAKAAYQLGSGLYNMTYAGNARVVLAESHANTSDTSLAQGWFKRAYESSRDRELKARAATMAAKCELAGHQGETVSRTWYPALRALSDTAYYKEVLAECGWFREWDAKQRKQRPRARPGSSPGWRRAISRARDGRGSLAQRDSRDRLRVDRRGAGGHPRGR